jgi:hypothetical protein
MIQITQPRPPPRKADGDGSKARETPNLPLSDSRRRQLAGALHAMRSAKIPIDMPTLEQTLKLVIEAVLEDAPPPGSVSDEPVR